MAGSAQVGGGTYLLAPEPQIHNLCVSPRTAFLLLLLSPCKYPENSAAPILPEDANHRVSSPREHLRYVPHEDISGTSPRGSNLTLGAYKVHSFPTTFQTCEDEKLKKGKSDSEERTK